MSEPLPEAAAAAAEPTPLPPRPRAPAALVVLATLAVGYTLWAAQEVILPVLLAMSAVASMIPSRRASCAFRPTVRRVKDVASPSVSFVFAVSMARNERSIR